MKDSELRIYLKELSERLRIAADLEGEEYKCKCINNEDVDILVSNLQVRLQ
jgi:hypothetical protein